MRAAISDAETSSSSLSGVVRKRRILSKRLAFVDLEADGCASVALVCDGWALSKAVASGVHVRVEGAWETLEDGRRRFAVLPHAVEILEDPRGENAWSNASETAAWRARVRAISPDLPVGMCLAWADAGRCSDPTCVARHAASTRWETRRRDRAARERSGAVSDPAVHPAREDCASGGGASSGETAAASADVAAHGPLAAKSKHNAVFARWLVETFGVDRLVGPNREGVADVAGGRGMLALELALEHGVPAVVVEPKKMRLNKSYRKRVRKWRAARAEGSDREALDEWDPEAPSDTAAAFSFPVRQVRAAYHGEELGGDFQSRDDSAPSAPSAAAAAAAAIRDAGVLLAMHPDAAAEPVVDAAIAHGKPFAVVPCCVFASAFPDRRRPDGAPVASYEDLLEYLQAKAPDVRRAELPCEGRRVVLWRREPTGVGKGGDG